MWEELHQLHTVPRTAWVLLQEGAPGIDFGMLPSGLQFTLDSSSLRVGDIVLFDGWVPHRGPATDGSCVGLHAYLDVPEVVREKDPTKVGSFTHLSLFKY